MTVPRLVLDTNVLVSTLLFPAGSVSWLRRAWHAGTILPLASRETTMELIRVLSYPKFRLSADEKADLLADFLPWCESVAVSHPPAVPNCRDPLDLPFLELAAQGHADALVTGDGDLLALAPVFAIPILTPNAARSRWGQGSTDRMVD